MENNIDVKPPGTICIEQEDARSDLESSPDQDVSMERFGGARTMVLSTMDRSGHHTRKYKQSLASGLTGREYQVLRIINTHGWCTSEMVRRIAELHGLLWSGPARRAHQLVRRLEQNELIASRKIDGGTRTRAYAVTPRGLRYILAEGDALLCDTNAIKDPASAYHFLGLNKIMLDFRSQFQTKFWLSDFEVRSDNSFIGRDGLAKDYDSVADLMLPGGGHVRFGIEYERSQQSAKRHEKLNNILLSEKRLQFVLFFLGDPRFRSQLMAHLKSLGSFAYFVEYDLFLKLGMEAPVYYWNENKMYQAPLTAILKHASRQAVQDYVPIHQLDLRIKN
jgi:DNA-binding MarR family transcriptional regulator